MKKQSYILFGTFIALFAYIGLFFLINAFFGNPISRRMVDIAVERTIVSEHTDHSVVVEDIRFNIMKGYYEASLVCDSGEGEHFTVCVDMFGRIVSDDYEDVLLRKQVAQRMGNFSEALLECVIDIE